MASTPTHSNGHAQVPPHETHTPYSSTELFRPVVARRSPSFSTSPPPPPHLSCDSLKFLGVPFSWEKHPGIPKQQSSKNEKSSRNFLPLPPPAKSNPSKKHIQEEISPNKMDPFFAAFLECSKNDDDGNIWKGSKITRSLSARFGFINMYTSCKRSCAVSESAVYLPRSSSHYLVARRSS
ncbi:unnamed protein product [Fraxinus pennsylvanica]|uniref:Uncharacterized protein n=1 Tax=Fraxinus pennsylvanica TaxID=56036 RepID=A0AAD2EG16_9LAMI|nr:unnamed protein product [Fraxinus pennsylvanica]